MGEGVPVALRDTRWGRLRGARRRAEPTAGPVDGPRDRGGSAGHPGRLRHVLRPRRVPTTSAGVEWLLAATFLAFRALDVGQTLMALSDGLRDCADWPVDLLAVVVLAAESLWLAGRISRAGAYRSARLAWADAATGTVLLAATWVFTRPDQRFTSWVDWGYPVTMSVAYGSALAFRTRWKAALVPVVLAGVYLGTTLPGLADRADTVTALTNSLTYPTVAAVGWLASSYLRRLAADADRARAEAAGLAADLERRRHQDLLHDHATVLDVLARTHPDEPRARLARTQAALRSAQIRAFLRGDEPPAGTLAAALAPLGAANGDLPLTMNTALADGVLPAATVAVLVGATRTLLDNARWHAEAGEVVVHAETAGGRWEITVTDDGVGYDPAATAEGYGLAQQVRRAVTDLGGTVDVTSAPGAGTSVRLASGLLG